MCDDLQKIYDATSLKTKYGYLQTQWKNDFNSVNDMEIIYIVPENMKFKEKEPELQTLYFEDFPQSVSIFPQEYKLISQKLKDLDKN